MASTYLLGSLHLIAVAQFSFAIYYVNNWLIIPNTKEHSTFHSFGGNYRFLTNWNVVVQAVFFTICLLNDFIGTNAISPKRTPVIRKVKDFVHASLGFPLAAFVTMTFWGLYAADRELVLPKVLDPYFPLWLNHLLHTNVLVFTLVELFISFRVFPKRKTGLLALSGFMLVYLLWTFMIFGKTGRWVYPVMEILNWPQRIAFILSLLVFAQVLYFFGELINKFIWKRELRMVQGISKKSKSKSR